MGDAGRETEQGVREIDPLRDVVGESRLDARIAALADRQHGVVSLEQLRSAGLSERAVQMRAARGRLHRIHRGVYAVGRRGLDVKGRFTAAVLACGPTAALSHRAAAHMHGLLQDSAGAIDVLVASRSGRSRPGVTVHRSATLVADEVTAVEGIPATTVDRTLLDLAAVSSARQLAHAIEAAERLRIYDGKAIERVLGRAGKRPAAKRLRRAIAQYDESPATKSELERRAHALFAEAGLPRPLVNASIETAGGPIEVDFHWPDRGLIVETDGYAWHSTRRAFEDDRRRDQLLQAAGHSVVRVTWRQLVGEQARVLRALVQIGLRA